MCEHFVARAADPFRIDELWPLTERLERYGIAGFGWGAGWLDGAGRLKTHRDTRAFHDDPARAEVGGHETTALLVHLRRPSRLSTLGLADTQPFDDPAGRFAFSHNGDFKRHPELRDTYRAQGRIHGKADTEVGARWLEDAWRDGRDVGDLFGDLHTRFEGPANMALITRSGAAYHYAGNDENPVFTFRLGPIDVASTGIYSLDRSLFKFVVPAAADRRLVPRRTTVQLGPT